MCRQDATSWFVDQLAPNKPHVASSFIACAGAGKNSARIRKTSTVVGVVHKPTAG